MSEGGREGGEWNGMEWNGMEWCRGRMGIAGCLDGFWLKDG